MGTEPVDYVMRLIEAGIVIVALSMLALVWSGWPAVRCETWSEGDDDGHA